MSAYSEKLKDPRWQRKRLEILQRDNWTCQVCGATDKTLNVHHQLYLKRSNPWDYPEWLLQTLCEPCHAEQPPAPQLVESILSIGGRPEDIKELEFLFQHRMPAMTPDHWKVFDWCLWQLAGDLATDFTRLKAEYDEHVAKHGFRMGADE